MHFDGGEKTKRILITGGAGFIGHHLVKELSKEFEVVVLDNLSTGRFENIGKYETGFIRGNIYDNEKLEEIIQEGFDYIFHLAAQVSVKKSFEYPVLDMKTNILGTLNLLKYAEKYDVKKLVYFSSAAVYGNPQYLPIDENHLTNPLSPYGLSKLTAEKYCGFFDVPCVILRLFNVYGTGQQIENAGVISRFIDNIKNNRPVEIFGDGNQSRDFIHVNDVVEVAKLSLKHEGIFNIGSGEGITINELIEKLFCFTKKDFKQLYHEKKTGEIIKSVANIEKAKNIIGWKPNVKLDDGLKELFFSGRPEKKGE